MSKRDEDIRRVVAELEAQLATVEKNLAVLRTLVAEDDGEGSAGG